MSQVSITDRDFAGRFGAAADGLPGAGLPWLATLRRAGLERFAAGGLPTPRTEDWKYTNLRALEAQEFVPAPMSATVNGVEAGALPSLLPQGQAAHRLVFVNGRLRTDLSDAGALPKGVVIAGLADLLEREPALVEPHLGVLGLGLGDDGKSGGRPFLALNTAAAGDGYVVFLPDGAELEIPVAIVFASTAADGGPVACHPRNLIVAGAGSRATVLEQHVQLAGGAGEGGGGGYFANSVTEIVLGEGAALVHLKLQDEGAGAFHIASTEARVAAGASYDNFSLSLGARLARNEIRVRLAGADARCALAGAYLAGGRQHTDTTTVIDHAEPDTASREVYKGVLDGTARAVFQGRITVHPDAQRSDGHQLNRALLLSDGAEIDSKPALEVFADDVKCSHGATVGEIDDEALFYLRTRGVPEAEARAMLVAAFIDEVLEEIADPVLRDGFRARVAGRLAAWSNNGATT